MRVFPSASEAERVPVSPDVVVSEDPAVSAMDPAVGVERTGASSAPLMVMVMVCVELSVAVSVKVSVVEAPAARAGGLERV